MLVIITCVTLQQQHITIDKCTYPSLRFYPPWDAYSTYHISGLIHLILDIVKIGENLTGVEVGSFIGESSTLFLSFPQITSLTCIDAHDQPLLRKRLQRFINDKRCVYVVDSSEKAAKALCNTYDFVYIDADHSYQSVKQDIHLWFPKVRSGGVICGHDYSSSWPGVMQAVDEFIDAHNLELKCYEDSSWSVIKNN